MLRSLCLTLTVLVLTACSQDPVTGPVGRGKQVFNEHCLSCHSTSPDLVIVGPSLDGVATRARETGEARAYLMSSIVDPGALIVEGYDNLMPGDFSARLRPADLEALVAYLMTLE